MESSIHGVLLSQLCAQSNKCKKGSNCTEKHPVWAQRLKICVRYLKSDQANPCVYGANCHKKHWNVQQILANRKIGDQDEIFVKTVDPQDQDETDPLNVLEDSPLDNVSSASESSNVTSQQERDAIQNKIDQIDQDLLNLNNKVQNRTISRMIDELFDQRKLYAEKLKELLNVKTQKSKKDERDELNKPIAPHEGSYRSRGPYRPRGPGRYHYRGRGTNQGTDDRSEREEQPLTNRVDTGDQPQRGRERGRANQRFSGRPRQNIHGQGRASINNNFQTNQNQDIDQEEQKKFDKEDKQKKPKVVQPQLREPICLAFLGQTGSGKTTLLHSLRDYIEDRQFNQRRMVAREQAEGSSQTKNSTQYSICKGDKLVNIIDTPGLCDTEGGKVDEQHLQDITNMIINQGEFHAICFVMKGSDVRAVTSLKFAINEIKGLLPKDVKGNIIICVTRQPRDSISSDFKGVLQQLEIDVENVITFENSAYEELVGKPSESDQKQQQQDYLSNKKKLKQLIDTAAKMEPYKSEGIKLIKEKRHNIKEEIQLMMDVMDDCCNAKLQLDQFKKAISQTILDKDLNKNFQLPTKVKRTRKIQQSHGSHSTVCSCGNICHSSCGVPYGGDLTQCMCMGGGNKCRQCPSKCQVFTHSHTRYCQEEVYYEEIIVEDPDKKKIYESAEEKQQHFTNLKDEADQKILEEDQKINICQQKIKLLYEELEQLAFVGFNENYEQYLEETKRSINNDTLMSYDKKKLKIFMIQKAIDIYSSIKANLIQK